MYSYIAYGLAIRSDFALEELLPGYGEADITVRLSEDDSLLGKHSLPPNNCLVTATEACFYWEDAGWFLVREGREIIVRPRPDVDRKYLGSLVTGWVLALALHQRKMLVLHASAVSIHGRGVLIMGLSGGGKSSLAGALVMRGHVFLTDDVSVVKEVNGLLSVIPSFPSLKLFPDALAALGHGQEEHKPVFRGSAKTPFKLRSGFQTKPVPVKRIYSLADGDSIEIEPLKSADAVMELVRGTPHVAVEAPENRVHHLLQCGDLARQAPVLRLRRSLAVCPLLDVAIALEEDACSAR